MEFRLRRFRDPIKGSYKGYYQGIYKGTIGVLGLGFRG